MESLSRIIAGILAKHDNHASGAGSADDYLIEANDIVERIYDGETIDTFAIVDVFCEYGVVHEMFDGVVSNAIDVRAAKEMAREINALVGR